MVSTVPTLPAICQAVLGNANGPVGSNVFAASRRTLFMHTLPTLGFVIKSIDWYANPVPSFYMLAAITLAVPRDITRHVVLFLVRLAFVIKTNVTLTLCACVRACVYVELAGGRGEKECPLRPRVDAYKNMVALTCLS